METGLAAGAAPWIAGGCIGLFLLAAARRPMKWLLKLAVRTAAWLAGLALLAQLAQRAGWTGVRLGVNCWNALLPALLGAPGFGLLLLLRWFFLAGI